MYESVTVVGERGQITIPKTIREKEGLKKKDKVIVKIENDKIVVEKALSKKEKENLRKGSNAETLADAIILLKRDENLRIKIADNGYETFKKTATPEKVGRQLKKIIMDLF